MLILRVWVPGLTRYPIRGVTPTTVPSMVAVALSGNEKTLR
jgi:hypothetical protein